MLPDEVEHLVEGDARQLCGSSDGYFPLAEEIERVVDSGFSEPPLNEPAEGLRAIGLQALGKPVDLLEAFLRQPDRDRLGHVYDIFFCIQRPIDLRGPGRLLTMNPQYPQ